MRKAFHVDTGPLTDKSVVESERQAMSDVYAGAIGLFKNPGSHRHIRITVEEGAELLTLASRLNETRGCRERPLMKAITNVLPPRIPAFAAFAAAMICSWDWAEEAPLG